MTCLEHLFPLVVSGGLVIIDDYGLFDGCNLAVHRYLAEHDRLDSIWRTRSNVAYIWKV